MTSTDDRLPDFPVDPLFLERWSPRTFDQSWAANAAAIIFIISDRMIQPTADVEPAPSHSHDGCAWIPALVTPGFKGNGHVRWSAETTGTSFHRCGHAERRGLANDAMLRVFTDSDCVKGHR